MCADESVEHVDDAVEHYAALLIGEDSVLECRLLLVIDNLLDVFTLILYGSLDCRQIVGLLNLAEVGRAKWQAALLQKRIRTIGARALGERCGWHLQEGSYQAKG